jgi:hypothetical protein
MCTVGGFINVQGSSFSKSATSNIPECITVRILKKNQEREELQNLETERGRTSTSKKRRDTKNRENIESVNFKI